MLRFDSFLERPSLKLYSGVSPFRAHPLQCGQKVVLGMHSVSRKQATDSSIFAGKDGSQILNSCVVLCSLCCASF